MLRMYDRVGKRDRLPAKLFFEREPGRPSSLDESMAAPVVAGDLAGEDLQRAV